MLSELKMVGEWFQNEPSEAWDFKEIVFDTKTKNKLSDLNQPNRTITVLDHSAKVELIGRSKNSCYIPGQYFVYALKLRPLLTLLKSYERVLIALSNEVKSKRDVIKVLSSKDRKSVAISKLDCYSQERFFEIFGNDSARLNAKEFYKDNDSHRTFSDFFSSILLAAIPVPNASSGTLADLLLSISEYEEIFLHIQKYYNDAIPWLFRTDDGDELMLRVMSTLGWDGKLDELQENEPVSWGDIADVFLLRPTPEPSNDNYISTPVHYLESCNKYVFVRKGLLGLNMFDTVSAKIAELWPGMCVRRRGGKYYVESDKRDCMKGPPITGGTNSIFYGAPGTGKSYKVHQVCSYETDKFVTVFHPDTQHSDFVGSLKPVTESGCVVYRFRAGPFTDALVHALINPDRKVTLVIEEINRASAAAVFGELFQLLDRNPDGGSTYSIRTADPDMLGYINHLLKDKGFPSLEVLRIPANLSLLATMNSSDQAVMPLDTAFKRRWRFEYLPIDFSVEGVPQIALTLATTSGEVTLTWPKFAKCINAALVECDVAEDRLLGPFFLSAKELEDQRAAMSALEGKLFIYLWDDVLRHHGHERIFSNVYKTYGALSAAFKEGKPVFSLHIEEALAKVGERADSAAESLASDSGTDQDAVD
ncbi:AAA family ATPase [Alkalimonas sp. MEB108]|uniref:AAA family ATPase n=1 Tax=Alkalimonas cellulosilytica TaxID=3058395 RepID=A0ABU7JBI0_9GAMM|nr:AAA family ATPase [Alkalimonas sp. MEB108]MEE2003245.1 AAA family ATPase [Alkalimonas sp. MEB108]